MTIGCIGELVVDFIGREPADSIEEAGEFVKCAGGSPANVAAGLFDQGLDVVLLTQIGKGKFGTFLQKVITRRGMTTGGLLIDSVHPTRCVFMVHDLMGRRSIEIANRDSADQHIQMDQFNLDIADGLDVLHVGGTTMLGSVTSAVVFALVNNIKSRGGLVTFDPNINLQRIPLAAQQRVLKLLPLVDVLKVNDSEWETLQELRATMPKDESDTFDGLVICTKGVEGAIIKSPTHQVVVEALPVNVVDVTGAGDAFFSGFLGCLLNHQNDVQNLSIDLLRTAGNAGAQAAAKVIQHFGGYLSQ